MLQEKVQQELARIHREMMNLLENNTLNDRTLTILYAGFKRGSSLLEFAKKSFSDSSLSTLFDKVLSPTQFPTHRELLDMMLEDYENYKVSKKEDKPYTGFFLPEENGVLWTRVYHIPTVEFEDALAEFINSLGVKVPILEIGAGDGKLSYGLQQRRVPIIATDNDEIGLSNGNELVEKISHDKALEKYNPELVIVSWLPPESGIQKDIVQFPSVQHFLEIKNCNLSPRGPFLNRRGVDDSGREILKQYKEVNYIGSDNKLFARCEDTCFVVDSLSSIMRYSTPAQVRERLKEGKYSGPIRFYTKK
ncbi:hypothetical protein KY339_03360 [Candidatus Woesearchaeota archaeon]|nr:hypothetical protein [Candidatus Woesearchaeota archaeon]